MVKSIESETKIILQGNSVGFVRPTFPFCQKFTEGGMRRDLAGYHFRITSSRQLPELMMLNGCGVGSNGKKYG